MAESRPPLAGDLIARALARTKASEAAAPALPARERSGGLDAESLAEFLAYDVPFDVEPATGFAFPAGSEER